MNTLNPLGMYRNRKLLDLAHRIQQCTNCGAWRAEGMDPAHSNQQDHGKGKALKGHDCFFAALCSRCHRWLDNQGGLGKDPSGRYDSTREDKRQMFNRAMHTTWLEMWRQKLVRVS